MTKGMFGVVAVVAAIVIVGSVGLTVTARSDEAESRPSGFLRHLHEMGHRLHHGPNHQNPMAELIEELDLTPEQTARLEKVHEILGARGGGDPAGMLELHESLMAQFEQGRIETVEIRGLIDGHVEQIREMAYAVTDEMIALVNELDDGQREVLRAHLQERDHAPGH